MSFIKLFSGNHKNKIVCIWTSVGWGFVAYFASNWQRCPVGVVGEERSDWGIVFRKQLGVPLYQCSRTYHKLAGNERERPSMTQAILCSKVQLKKLSNTAYHNKLTNFHYCKINASGIVPLWGYAMYWAACQYIQPLGIYKQRPIRVLSSVESPEGQ